MNIEQIINDLDWKSEEYRLVKSTYKRIKHEQQYLEQLIAKKMVEMKFKLPFDAAKFLEVPYDPDFSAMNYPNLDSPCIVHAVYETFTIDLKKLHALIYPVIKKHMENGYYPSNVYRLVIGPELNEALNNGNLPNYQFEFGCNGQFRIVYCPDIRGIAVLP